MKCINCGNLCENSCPGCSCGKNLKPGELFCKSIEKEITQREAHEDIFCGNFCDRVEDVK